MASGPVALELELEPEDWEGTLEVRSGLDGRVENDGVERYSDLEGRHLDVLTAERAGEDRLLLRSRTRQSRLEVAQVVRTQAFRGERRLEVARATDADEGWIAERLSVDVGPDAPVRIEKVLALYTSRDHAISEHGVEADGAALRAEPFEVLLTEHCRAWGRAWEAFDFELELADEGGTAGDATQCALRLHTLHLLQTVSLHSADLDVSVPARGWHGEAYRGHIFWDELFVFPLLALRCPTTAKSLLLYRYRRLPAARRAAEAAGRRGAMFPWQSGSNGREESQRLHLNPKSGRWVPDNSHRQRHIGSAIAYNVWHYHQVCRFRLLTEAERARVPDLADLSAAPDGQAR